LGLVMSIDDDVFDLIDYVEKSGDKHINSMDASVFSGDMLHTHLQEFEDYIARWQRAIKTQKQHNCDEEKE